jgi:hypothetical protein
MINFSIEAFIRGYKTITGSEQNREQMNRQLLETYVTYLQQQTGSN